MQTMQKLNRTIAMAAAIACMMVLGVAVASAQNL